MKDDDVLNAASAEVLGNEDTQELAANLAMYLPHHKDPLDSSTTQQTALEATPFFDQTVTARGYNPLKDEWSLATQLVDLDGIQKGIFEGEQKGDVQQRRPRQQPKRRRRRNRRGD